MTGISAFGLFVFRRHVWRRQGIRFNSEVANFFEIIFLILLFSSIIGAVLAKKREDGSAPIFIKIMFVSAWIFFLLAVIAEILYFIF